MIPMRDGVKLHTKIFAPRGEHGPLPILMQRTPYGIAESGKGLDGPLKELADDGYVFVFQDLRGKFGSEGVFVMQRPARAPGDTKALDEGTDTFDTIAWLLENVPANNGRVGMLGISYEGWTTIMGALEPHPALAAISPQASPSDMWLGDDFHHNGAFRLSYGFEYAYWLEAGKNLEPFGFDRYDTYRWYLALGPLSNVNALFFHGKIPTWNDFVEHPDYDEFWKKQTMIPHIREVKVPTLNVAGWWDQEDFFGPLQIYAALEKHDPKDVNRLVVGPWNHGGWGHGDGEKLGAIPFDGATAKYFRQRIQAPWFAHYLKGRGAQPLPEALTFEAGTNRWERWEAWPPVARTQVRNLYFGPDGSLSFDPPAPGAPKSPEASDAYGSDPAHPVPYRKRPIQTTYFPGGSKWSTWLVEDQRFVEDRSDVLTFETAPLAEDVTIAGEVVAHLFASTTGSDADWVVKLIDVYPERYPENWDLAGYELMVSNEVFRGRYRKSFERPEPIAPNAVLDYTYSLHTQSYAFRKGHRIMVQVQSSWFPVIDRNPQTFVPNIFKAGASDFKAADAPHLPLPGAPVPRRDSRARSASRVNRLRLALVLGVLFGGASAGAALAQQPAEEDVAAPLHVLFIGNSLTYTNNLPGMFRALAEAAGKSRPFVRAVTGPGFSLEDQWNQGDAQKAIAVGSWDYVVLQQGPSASADGISVLRAYSERFAKQIRGVGGKPVLYMVWPSTGRPQDFDGVVQSYAGAARSVGGLLCPAGDAWRLAWKQDPKIAFYSSDGLHPTAAGTYVAALTFFGLFYGQSPVGLPAKLVVPGGASIDIPPGEARVMQEAAAEAGKRWGR